MGSAKLIERARYLVEELDALPEKAKIATINAIRKLIHDKSPFKNEPVDCVLWVKAEETKANDYNPNSVAPPEMKLLEHSISEDGYTQPVVTWEEDGHREVIDGFHRNRVGKESEVVRARTLGYLPVVTVNVDRTDRNDRIASTIRHNRARGKHQVSSMSDIVVELKRRNWADARICRELGMDQDEVLRLCQITGLTDLFSNQEFSKAWDVEGEVTESDFLELTDDVESYGEEVEGFRTVNTSDENRVFHTYHKWECYKAGFYSNTKEGMSKTEAEAAFRDLIADNDAFKAALKRVITEWTHSCEHYLTNASMNRIAWLGQAAVCIATGIPSAFRSGYFLLTPEQQEQANQTALRYLNKWLMKNDREEVTMKAAISGDRQSDIY